MTSETPFNVYGGDCCTAAALRCVGTKRHQIMAGCGRLNDALLTLIALLLFASHCAAKVCTDIPAAKNHYTLTVQQSPITLPFGKGLHGLKFNHTHVGPTITAVLGEEVSIDVMNQAAVGTSVHWHGQEQHNNSWADGTAHITQAPIPPNTTFRYKLKAAPAGTFWYHSHVGMQLFDGLRGPLIVKDPRDPYRKSYDEELLMFVTDQNDFTGEQVLRDLQTGAVNMPPMCTNISNQDFSDIPLTTILTNGAGWYKDPKTGRPTGKPAVFRVQHGKRYRLRIIQAAGSWGMKITIDKHKLDVIALDGYNIKPQSYEGLVITPAERVDVILHADQPVGNYWINIATLPGQNSPAVLSYVGAPDVAKVAAPKLDLGCDWGLARRNFLDSTNVTHVKAGPGTPKPPPVTRHLVLYLTNSSDTTQNKTAVLGSKAVIPSMPSFLKPQTGCPKLANGNDSQYCWGINWVVYVDPESKSKTAHSQVPLLFPGAKPSNSTYIQQVVYGDVVDLVIVNTNTMVHPMHLHGHHFWVLGTGYGSILKKDGTVNYSKLNTKDPVYRDTQPVPHALGGGGGGGGGGDGGDGGSSSSSSSSTKKQKAGSSNISQERKAVAPKRGSRSSSSSSSSSSKAAPGRKLHGLVQSQITLNDLHPLGRSLLSRSLQIVSGSSGSSSSSNHSAMSSAKKADHQSTRMGSMGPSIQGSSQTSGGGGNSGSAPIIPSYAVFRVHFNNPGVWLFHCHIQNHMATGMQMVFRVRSPKSALPWALPDNVTKCGMPSK